MDNRELTKQWVEHWKRVGPILEKVRHDELRAMTDEQSRQAFTNVCEYVQQFPRPAPRLTSGFVEQQRLFMRLLLKAHERT